MKKFIAVGLSALVLASPFVATAAEVEAVKVEEAIEVEEVTEVAKLNGYVTEFGTIKEITADDEKASVLFTTKEVTAVGVNEFRSTFDAKSLIVNDETLELDSFKSLEKDAEVTVHYPENTPIGMSLPPVLTPEVLVINKSEKPVTSTLNVFDENLTSKDNSLKLNIGEDTVLVNLKGEAVEAKDLANQKLLVFYSASTKSIPAQTTPIKVFALGAVEDKEEATDLVLDKVLVKDKEVALDTNILIEDNVYLPVRAIAEALGYEVSWKDEEQVAVLTLGETVVEFETVAYDELGEGVVSAVLKDTKTLVPMTLLEEALGVKIDVNADKVFTINIVPEAKVKEAEVVEEKAETVEEATEVKEEVKEVK